MRFGLPKRLKLRRLLGLGADLPNTGGGGGGYVAKAVHFDGATVLGFVNQAQALSADSSTGLISVWGKGADIFNKDAIGAQGSLIGDVTSDNFSIGTPAFTNQCTFSMYNAANSSHYNGGSTAALSTTLWTHLLASWDMNFSLGSRVLQIYYSDVLQTLASPSESGGAFIVNYSDTGWEFGANNVFDSGFAGPYPICDQADLQFWTGLPFVDLSTTSNRRVFIDGSGKPVNPTFASTLFGAPLILLSGDASGYATNQGNAGASQVIAGTLTNATTSPSD